MAFAARLGSLTDELIEVVASSTIQTDPNRLEVLRESSLRKLRQHNFLGTNHFEVYNALDGYEERFRVLNREGLANALRVRLDALAQCSNKWTPEILHLLLQLADQPVQKSHLGDLDLLNEPEEDLEPELKWKDIAKEDHWDQDRDLWRNVEFGGYSSDEGYIDQVSDASSQSEDTSPSSVEARYRKRPTDYKEEVDEYCSDLEDIRNSQSWRRAESPVQSSVPPSQKVTITEIQLIREILFMLGGLANNLFDGRGKPSYGVQLTQVSWQMLRSILLDASEAGQLLAVLREYVERKQQVALLQRFQDAIEKRLRLFDGVLAGVQARFTSNDQDTIASVLKLFDDLEPHIHPLKCLAGIVAQLNRVENPSPFHHLELLYDAAHVFQSEGDDEAYRFVGELFFECFEVYLRPIRRWMDHGELAANDETMFISSSPAKVRLSQIWADQFQLRRGPEGELFAPRFLQPAAAKIFTTGKSIVVLKLLGKYWATNQNQSESATRVNFDDTADFAPFSETFRDVFDQWMQSKHHAISATLKQELFHNSNFSTDLDVLQHLFLMCDGSRSDRFSDAVFNNIDILNASWHDRFNLTEIAREAFDGLVEPHRLNVSLSRHMSLPDVNDVRRTVRDGLPGIVISYQLPWLSRVVLSDDSLEHYQLVFTFLLQLRRASKTLIKHRLISDVLDDITADRAIFYGLRSKLLWFCNTFQSYLGTLVLGPLVASLQEEIRQAEDIDQMITAHAMFTKRMIDESCLGAKLEPIRQAILDIFDLAITIQDVHQREFGKAEEENHGSSRRSAMPSNRRYVQASEREDESFLLEQGWTAMMQDTEMDFRQALGKAQADFDRHLKFICGGLRGVARASGSQAASKWDILAEMLEVAS
ncbi:Spc98 family-domain-containing protein [Poronia punctata]|nr:Spc98 family-domain-containing protein [Poronia punctata]